MDQDFARHDPHAQETKRPKLRSPLVIQTDTDDSVGHATVNVSGDRTTSSRMSQNEGQATSEPSSTVSPVSSTDTFVTACEYMTSKEDCSQPEEASISSEPATLVSTDHKPTVTLTSAITPPGIEHTTQNSKEAVLDNFTNISWTHLGTQDSQADPKTTTAGKQPAFELAPSSVVNISRSRSQRPQKSTVPLNTSQSKGQSAEKTPNAVKPETSSPKTTTDDMTGNTRKAAKRQTRREKADLALMTAIAEEDPVEKFTTDYDPSKHTNRDEKYSEKPIINDEPADMAATEASSTEIQDQDATTTRTGNSTDTSSAGKTSIQSAATVPRLQATDIIGSRVVRDPLHGSLVGRPSRRGQMSANLLAAPWLFTYDHPHTMTNCWLASCGRPTTSSDGRTVICPRCTDRSYVRYCSVTHLLADMRDHYMAVCGKRENLLKIDETTITPVREPSREFIRVDVQDNDSGERHRQALYHAYPPESDITASTRPAADYYVFSDADKFQATGLPSSTANLYDYRCTGSIAGRVRYEQTDPRKALFATLLKRLLVMGTSAGRVNPKGCRMLCKWIRDNLEGQEECTEIMITRMCLAMRLEFGWQVDEDLRE